MSDAYIFSDADSLYAPEKKKTAGSFKSRLLAVFAVLLVLVLAVEAALYLVVIPCTAPVKLSFEGNSTVSAEHLYGLTALSGNETWVHCDSAAIAAKIASDPLFESVRVEKFFPDQIKITVNERVPVAVAFAETDGRTVPVQIDKNGVVFRIDEGIPSGAVPLVSGLTFENPRSGMRLNERLRPLMDQLAAIQASNPAYLSGISEIRIEPKSYGTYELVLYPVYSRTRVRTDRMLNEQSLQYMMVVLDVIGSLDSDVPEVDLRYGAVSYRQ